MFRVVAGWRAEDGDFELTCSIGDEKQQQYYRYRVDTKTSHNFLCA